MRTVFAFVLGLLVVVVPGAFGLIRYMTALPGDAHHGPLPPLTSEEAELAQRLKAHIVEIASRPHNIDHFDALDKAAGYLESTLGSLGYQVERQEFEVDGELVRNIAVTIEPADAQNADVLVVGAHYDSFEDAPGANDNGTGTAAVIELARLLSDLGGKTRKRLRLVLFVNEEPPYFKSFDMGSFRYARMLAERGERVAGMISLETLGYFSDEPGSQEYPAPFGATMPSEGNFIAFVGMLPSRAFLHDVVRSFRSHTAFPTVGGVAPASVPGIDWSDHWAFAEHGFPAIMITDTAHFRYPHYHKPTDTPDKIDADKLARVVKGLERTVRELVR